LEAGVMKILEKEGSSQGRSSRFLFRRLRRTVRAQEA
jgi:hypothetical protein